MSKYQKQTVFIISTGRAGSTAIYQYLNEMCDLKLPANKEPHFFTSVKKYKNLDGPILDCYVSSLKKYKKLYEKSKFIIDASVGYFFYIDEFIKRVKKLNINPKIIFLYREPIGRAVSLFNISKNLNMTIKSKLNDELTTKWEDGSWWQRYYDNVFYYDVYTKLNKNFKDILSINYDNFKKNNDNVMKKIVMFINCQIKNDIKYFPLNSSSDYFFDNQFFKIISKHLDYSFIKKSKAIIRYLTFILYNFFKTDIDNKILKKKLKKSIKQYKMFRSLKIN